MRKAIEGSQAIAEVVALCRPQVVAAYPITPQTHIVENISKLVADGVLQCELVSVESEFSAASVVLGAAAAGSRAYTASSSQGLLLMSEVLYNAAGLRIPLVMTCANRAVSAPLSIWNDQQDSMAVRDAGWIQLYCADNQAAIDTTVQAYRIAELTETPVMVCVDGFTLTHTLEPIELPEAALVDQYLPPFQFNRKLDPKQPISIGTLVSPDFFAEARHSQHQGMQQALPVIEAAAKQWSELVQRPCTPYFEVVGPSAARIAIITLGSVFGTLCAAQLSYADQRPCQIIHLRCFRPFPIQAIRDLCSGLDDIVVLERAFSPGSGPIVGTEIRAALFGMTNAPRVHCVAMGLGGRDIPLETYPRLLAIADAAEQHHFSIFDVELEKLPQQDR